MATKYPGPDNTGYIFKNDRKENDKQPTHKGNIRVEGVEYWVSAWTRLNDAGEAFLKVSVERKDTPKAAPPVEADVPF